MFPKTLLLKALILFLAYRRFMDENFRNSLSFLLLIPSAFILLFCELIYQTVPRSYRFSSKVHKLYRWLELPDLDPIIEFSRALRRMLKMFWEVRSRKQNPDFAFRSFSDSDYSCLSDICLNTPQRPLSSTLDPSENPIIFKTFDSGLSKDRTIPGFGRATPKEFYLKSREKEAHLSGSNLDKHKTSSKPGKISFIPTSSNNKSNIARELVYLTPRGEESYCKENNRSQANMNYKSLQKKDSWSKSNFKENDHIQRPEIRTPFSIIETESRLASGLLTERSRRRSQAMFNPLSCFNCE